MKAFPIKGLSNMTNGQLYEAVYNPGMDLRDYFAAQAPIYLEEAFRSLQEQTKTTMTDLFDKEVIEELARLSYVYADAMMKARNA